MFLVEIKKDMKNFVNTDENYSIITRESTMNFTYYSFFLYGFTV